MSVASIDEQRKLLCCISPEWCVDGLKDAAIVNRGYRCEVDAHDETTLIQPGSRGGPVEKYVEYEAESLHESWCLKPHY